MELETSFKAAVVTVSDSAAQGDRQDLTGPALAEVLTSAGFEVAQVVVVPDEQEQISRVLKDLADGQTLNLILTAGGTGLSPRDRTPEATLAVIDRQAPGLPEAMRRAGLAKTPHAALSRGVAGTRGLSLILNLPGSPKGAKESLESVLPALPHALEKLAGDPSPCGD
ncbi:MAG: MogA/MoaB family molybdenum cofactor biosynthesis protein [Deltaproteobacteria bacterium]|nr:MogA/MoaB family molybdenum cofactor biosynthesis protein [Deltaproteobacteria bacterium]